MKEHKSNLFVVGAMKAGTTSFIELISNHADIFVPPIKEPHFFIDELPKNLYDPSRFFNLEHYFNKEFPAPLHITKIEKKAQYDKIYSLNKKKKYLVDGSTAYLHAPESPSLIYDYNPNAKIIILLRDSIQRAYSHYKMDLGKGRVYKKFGELISTEIEKYNIDKLGWNSYLGMSFYREPVKRYKDLFESVLILSFEDLANNQIKTLRRVSEYLGIDKFNSLEEAHKNETKTLRYQKIFYFFKKIGFKDYFSTLFSQKFRRRMFNLVSKRKVESLELSTKILNELGQIFKRESI